MRIKLGVLILLTSLISCSEKLSLQNELACSNLPNFENTIAKTDFKKNFSLQFPASWKHKGYYDEYQSSVFAADTVKELTETYVLDVAYKYNAITIDNNFKDEVNKSNPFEVLKSNIETHKERSSYWQVSKGRKSGYIIHEFHQFIKDNSKGYVEIKIELYGEKMVDERLCEALDIINTIEIK